MTLARQGRYHEALDALEDACRLNPFNEGALRNLACIHNNLGVILLKKQDWQPALDHFRAARLQKPEDIQIRFNLVTALLQLQRPEEAAEELRAIQELRPDDSKVLMKVALAFERIEDRDSALEALLAAGRRTPPDPQIHLTLGKHFARLGNFDEARYHLQIGREHLPNAPETKDLTRRLEQEQSLATAFETETGIHFVVRYEADLERDDALTTLDQLEDAYLAVGELLGHFPRERTRVLLCRKHSTAGVPEIPDWAGGMYDGTIRIPVTTSPVDKDWVRAAVFHEYTHHVVDLLTHGACPTWLNEGLAQFMEGRSLEEARSVLRNNRTYPLLPLDQLHGTFADSRSRAEAAVKYAQALIGVSILMENEGPYAVKTVLQKLGRDIPVEQALQTGAAVSLTELHDRIRQSLEG